MWLKIPYIEEYQKIVISLKDNPTNLVLYSTYRINTMFSMRFSVYFRVFF